MGSTVHGVAKSRTDWVTFTCTYLCENTSDSTDEGISPTRLLPPPTPDATCKCMLSPVILTHQLLIQSSGNTLLRFNLFARGVRACMPAKSLQSCPTLCNPMDYSPQGSSVPVILQARLLQWDAIPFSRRGAHRSQESSLLTIYCLL